MLLGLAFATSQRYAQERETSFRPPTPTHGPFQHHAQLHVQLKEVPTPTAKNTNTPINITPFSHHHIVNVNSVPMHNRPASTPVDTCTPEPSEAPSPHATETRLCNVNATHARARTPSASLSASFTTVLRVFPCPLPDLCCYIVELDSGMCRRCLLN